MKSALALATALLMPAVTSAAAVPPSDVLETRGKQIVGGSAASAGEFPFIVSLSQGGSHFCGGSLLNAYTVVTAAHCSVGQSPSSVKVRAGTLTWASGGTQVGVSSIVVNPNYNSGTYNNDVALWHLSSPIQSGGNIGYVSLPSSGSDPASGSTSTVAGWGVTNESSGSLTSSLRKVDVPIVSRSTCRSQYGTSAITTGMVCAGVPQGGKDSCQGDSGGPLLNSADQLIGIVSWGEGCARPDLSGVYTNVGNYVSWINSNKWTS